MNVTKTYSEVRKHLKKRFDQVCSDHVPLLVTRKSGENVVVISEDDFRALHETAYLCQSSKNLSRLRKAMNHTEGYSLEYVKHHIGI